MHAKSGHTVPMYLEARALIIWLVHVVYSLGQWGAIGYSLPAGQSFIVFFLAYHYSFWIHSIGQEILISELWFSQFGYWKKCKHFWLLPKTTVKGWCSIICCSATSAWENFSLTVGTGCHTAEVASGGTPLLIQGKQLWALQSCANGLKIYTRLSDFKWELEYNIFMKIALKATRGLVVNNFQDLEVNQTFCYAKLSHLASSVFIKPFNPKPHRYNNFDFTELKIPVMRIKSS